MCVRNGGKQGAQDVWGGKQQEAAGYFALARAGFRTGHATLFVLCQGSLVVVVGGRGEQKLTGITNEEKFK